MKKSHYPAVLFEDEHVLVLNKEAGTLTIPDRYDQELANLKSMLKARYGDIFVVHRLDRDTSGAILFAKTAEAHKTLNRQFQQRTVGKIYHAILAGVVQQDEIPIDIPLMPHPKIKGLMAPSVRGKESLTIVRPLQRFRMATLAECDMRSGRQHQIRVHCAAIGHPLLVDAEYGRSEGFMLSSIKRRYNLAKNTEERPLIARNTLHSYRLEFTHPFTGETLRFEAAYPKDFRATLQVLAKYAKQYQPADWTGHWRELAD